MGLNKIWLSFWSVVFVVVFPFTAVFAEDFSNLPVKGMVTMVDLGAKKCVPCKMMAPIMVKLEKAYEGKAAVVFIDVWENREQAKRFKIRAIPTQVFFDEQGNEVFRHVGFFDEKSIVDQMSKMGVEAPNLNKQG
jgi:thioredoxin 1